MEAKSFKALSSLEGKEERAIVMAITKMLCKDRNFK